MGYLLEINNEQIIMIYFGKLIMFKFVIVQGLDINMKVLCYALLFKILKYHLDRYDINDQLKIISRIRLSDMDYGLSTNDNHKIQI